MKSFSDVNLPPELEKYRKQIESTIKPCVKIMANPENDLTPWQSKFGGTPYLPRDVPYPMSTKGKPLFFLAQLDFEELPELFPFPNHGLLQIYISDDDLYGLSFHDMTKQGDFQIRFFEQTIKDAEILTTDFDFLPLFELVPISQACSLKFEVSQQPISVGDYQFEELIFNGNIPQPQEDYFKLLKEYEKTFDASGHRLGGYPYFTQSDPRGSKKNVNNDLRLLLQIDTDWDAGVMWGDAGVGNFFIREGDLKKRDFSRVMYNWDCA